MTEYNKYTGKPIPTYGPGHTADLRANVYDRLHDAIVEYKTANDGELPETYEDLNEVLAEVNKGRLYTDPRVQLKAIQQYVDYEIADGTRNRQDILDEVRDRATAAGSNTTGKQYSTVEDMLAEELFDSVLAEFN